MVEKRPFWAPKVMTGIPHILAMKNAIFRNVRVPEKHASHQPARSLVFFSCLWTFDHFFTSCFTFHLGFSDTCFATCLLIVSQFSTFPRFSFLYREQAAHKSLPSQRQKPGLQLIMLAGLPLLLQEKKIFLQTAASVSMYYNRTHFKRIF